MAEEAAAGGWYWCHMCASAVSAVAAAEGEVEIKCPYCHSGFLEEMETARGAAAAVATDGGGDRDGTDSGAGGAISVWAPIIDGMVGGDPVRRRRSRRHADASTDGGYHREMDHFDFSERRRRTVALLLLLQEFRERQLQCLESASAGGGGGSLDVEGVALADYFLGPGLDALMQRLGDGDAGRQGTLPTKKEAVEAIPTVEVTAVDDSAAACAVCLQDYAAGERAMEMPCRHRFHGKCIVPWLEMHSSCPVCRFQLPTDDDPNKGACGSGTHSGNADDGRAGAAVGNAAGVNASRLPAARQRLSSLFSQPGPSPSSAAPTASTSGSSSQHCDD
ncbi:hypothetical protein E2562_020621 [Oryza meyeriana var. granulata]|uniref:RING-type E3 ubiquitin transferase n=1 Tax=Oryza meyeriana var. granulata TaxID=110450 RepID=A0A6G1DYM0_9ORYZ|nr:hypothetical protein E2562_020621 [Oryza meyeriana var. granulata]